MVNTDNHDGPGIHWIALWVLEEFMDSFGHSPEYYGWTFNVPVLKNDKQLQSDDAITCGAYCLYFLHHRCRGRDMNSLLTDFHNDTRLNDKLVREFACRL